MIEGQEWLNVLVEDCKAILVETEFNGRYDTIKKYHQVGERIVSDNDFQKYGKGNAKLIKRIADQLTRSRSTIYYAVQFYEKYPDLPTMLETLPEGKDLSWRKIVQKYLPKAPKIFEPEETKTICPYCFRKWRNERAIPIA